MQDDPRLEDRMRVVPLTFPKANALVAALHRHHGPLPGGFAWFCVGLIVGRKLAGCAIAGRPTNRNNDDGQTVEVLRLATDGAPSGCSMMLGACAKAAQAIGARRIITYTLGPEGGASLRGAGWQLESEDTGRSWWTHAGSRTPAKSRPHMDVGKKRWSKVFGPLVIIDPEVVSESRQESIDLTGPIW